MLEYCSVWIKDKKTFDALLLLGTCTSGLGKRIVVQGTNFVKWYFFRALKLEPVGKFYLQQLPCKL
jgi:hypothetical protein